MTASVKQTGVEVKLTTEERDIFATISLVRRELMLAGMPAQVAVEYTETALRCDSYDELMELTRETVHVT